MRAGMGKLLLIVFVIGFAVCFGLDLASGGGSGKTGAEAAATTPAPKKTEASVKVKENRAQATLSPKPSTKPANAKSTGMEEDAVPASAMSGKSVKTLQAEEKAAEKEDIVVRTSLVNRASNRFGDALRIGAKKLISGVGSVFDAVTGS